MRGYRDERGYGDISRDIDAGSTVDEPLEIELLIRLRPRQIWAFYVSPSQQKKLLDLNYAHCRQSSIARWNGIGLVWIEIRFGLKVSRVVAT